MSKYSQDDDGNIHHSDHGQLNRSFDGTLRHPTSGRILGKHTAWNNSVNEKSLFDGGSATTHSSDGSSSGGSSADLGWLGTLFTFALKLGAAVAIFGTSLALTQLAYGWLSQYVPYAVAGAFSVPIILLGAALTDTALMRWLFPGLVGFLMACALWAVLAGFVGGRLMESAGLGNMQAYVAGACMVFAAIVRWNEGRAIGEREMPGLFGRQVVRLRDWTGYRFMLLFRRR